MPRLRRNILSGMILAVGNTLIILVSYPLYLKYLGMELYGLWATLSVVVSFTAIGRLGIDTAMIKYVAEEYGKDDRSGIEKYFSTAIVILTIGGVLIFLILFPLRGLLIDVLNIPEEYVPLGNALLPWMIILSIFIFLVRVIDGTLRGLGRVDLANYYTLGGRAISITATVIFLSFGYGIWSLFWGQVIFNILLAFLIFYTVYRKLGGLFFSIRSFDLRYLKKMIGFGGIMTAAQLISMLLTPFNKAVIARHISLSAVTYFEIANRVVTQLRATFDMSMRAIMPEVSRLSVSEDAQSKIDSVLRRAMKIVSYLGVPMFVACFFLASLLLRLWLSSKYVPEIAVASRIILVGYTANLLVIPVYYLFMGIGRVGYCFVNHLVQAILNSVAVLIFIVLGSASFYFLVV